MPSTAMQRLGTIYVAAVIEAFTQLARIKAPAVAEADGEVGRVRYAAVAVLPLTQILGARGFIETAPVVEWLQTGGALTRPLPSF